MIVRQLSILASKTFLQPGNSQGMLSQEWAAIRSIWPDTDTSLVREWQGGAGYLLAQEWAVLLLSLALAAVRKFMVTKLQ